MTDLDSRPRDDLAQPLDAPTSRVDRSLATGAAPGRGDHETGHALGLGDVPTPGVNIRECANMLMKRSVDKGGGHFTEPQPADVALLHAGVEPSAGMVRRRSRRHTRTRAGPGAARRHVASPAVQSWPTTAYRYPVLTCERIPEAVITPEQVESDRLPTDPGAAASARRPASCSTSIGTTGAGRSC